MLVRVMREYNPNSELAGKLEHGRLITAEIAGDEIHFDFAVEDRANPQKIIEKFEMPLP